MDFLHVNQDKAPYLSDTCGYSGNSHEGAPQRRKHEYSCRFQPTHAEQVLRNSAAKAAGFRPGVHCDRGLGGTHGGRPPCLGGGARHVWASKSPVRLDEARFVTEYLKLAEVSPSAPSCFRLPAAAGVAQLLAAAQAVAASPSIPGAGSSSGASPAPMTQQHGGTKRTSSGSAPSGRGVLRISDDPCVRLPWKDPRMGRLSYGGKSRGVL